MSNTYHPKKKRSSRSRRPRGKANHGGEPRTQAGRKPAREKARSLPPELPADPISFDEDNAFSRLLPELGQAVFDSGYSRPTPIQSQCIPHLLKGRDILGGAQTGTGKTAAFTLPLLQRIALEKKGNRDKTPRVLILAPTRELAAQINDSISTYSKYLDISHAVIFGGVGQRPQEVAMSRGVDFLVATPGRLLDLMNQGFIELDGVEAFVLDEADRMLDMGFIRDIRKVVDRLPDKRQTLFFSATLAPDIIQLAKTMLTDPERVEITPEKPTVEKIRQRLMFVDRSDKDALLVEQVAGVDKVIVFTQMKHAANKVATKLEKAGVSAAAIHGNKSQGARTRALEGFRNGTVNALVATDIAARGIDVDGVKLVVNYHLPVETETYIHRIGRTARAGAEGDAISFCDATERDQLRAIEKAIRSEIPVDSDQPYHSNTAQNARGEEAKPPARKGSGGGRGGNRRGNRRRR